MELLHRPLLFLLILFLSFSFFVHAAIECGDNQIISTIVVDQNGKGNFRTVQSAIDSIMEKKNRWIKVHINAGTYAERLRIPFNKSCIFLEGSGKNVTTITASGGYLQEPPNYASIVAEFNPSNMIVVGIKFKNLFDLKGSSTPILRAPAASILGDKTVFYDCSFVSVQDTLFDAQGRHYFKKCYIEGEVDFVYGSGQSYYEDCIINAKEGRSPTGFITAQSRASEIDPSGFIFKGCSIIGTGQVNLGRAWGPYSRVIFYESSLSAVVTPQGWDAWHFTGQESRFTYAEVNCTGPGADTRNRVKWIKKLSPLQLEEFSLSSFVNKDGWLSQLPLRVL